jgi:cell division protein FtsA
MAGTRLEAEVYIVTWRSASAAQNIRKAVDRAGYQVAELVLEPLASSLAVPQRGREGDRRRAGGAGRRHHRRGDLPRAEDPPPRRSRGAAARSPTTSSRGSRSRTPRRRGPRSAGARPRRLVDPARDVRGPRRAARAAARSRASCSRTSSSSGWTRSSGWSPSRSSAAASPTGSGGGVVLTGGGASLAGHRELAEAELRRTVRIGVPGEGLGGLVDSVRAPSLPPPSAWPCTAPANRSPRGRRGSRQRLAR